jgi:hypothetical protein
VPTPSRILIETVQNVICDVCGERLGYCVSDPAAAAAAEHPECPDPAALSCGAWIQAGPLSWDADKLSPVSENSLTEDDINEAWAAARAMSSGQ